MNSISKNSAITFSSQIFSFVLGFISSIILARALGPQTLGIYTLIILIPTIMLQFGSLGIGTANIYFTGKKKYKIEDIVSNSLIAAICLGAILILAIWSISHLDIFQNFLKSNQVKPLYLWLIVFTVPFSLLSNFLLNIFLGREEIVKYNKINIFQTTFQLLAFSIFLLILKKGIFGAMISYVLIVIVPSLLVYFLITKITTIKFILNKKLFKKSISYGLRVYLGNLKIGRAHV